MSDKDLDACFETAVDLAEKSGQKVHNVLSEKKDFTTKTSSVDLVTETDRAIEDFIFGGLKEKFPNHKFIGEESSSDSEGPTLTDEPTWIVDPIDGTMNFVHGLPFVAVSIALVINKKTEIAVIYSVGEQKLYTARRGKGSFCGSQQLKVSGTRDLSEGLILTELIGGNNPNKMSKSIENIGNIFRQARGVRSIGSAVTAGVMVARGVADAFYHFTIHCWDMAAIWLLVTEAGGVMKDPMGSDFDLMSHRMLCASSEEMAQQISKHLVNIPYQM